jgi:predicted RNA binding protein YcfA (HicA-like mRNA interferase family)
VVRRRLNAAGFKQVSQRGSHIKFVRSDEAGLHVVIVPNHKEIAVGTLRSILRQAGLTLEQFENL